MDSGYILEEEPSALADGLNAGVQKERMRGTKART